MQHRTRRCTGRRAARPVHDQRLSAPDADAHAHAHAHGTADHRAYHRDAQHRQDDRYYAASCRGSVGFLSASSLSAAPLAGHSGRRYYVVGACKYRAVPLGAPESPLHAGAYTWGIKGSNDCAAPSSRIVDPAACASAAAAAGKTYDGVVDWPAYPRGCAWCAPTRGT